MFALQVPASGAAPTLAELPTPTAGPGEALVRVRAAGLNPFDDHIAAGALEQLMEHRYPLVLGRDVSGVVEAVGEGVTEATVGDEVLAHVPFVPPIQTGTIAEYVVLAAASLVPKPAGIDHVTAAALPLAAGAAQLLVDELNPARGQVVLVNGASGGVGRYAVQLLAQRGVTVVATGTADDEARLLELGAASVVDFTAGPVAKQVLLAYPDGVDGMINLVGRIDDAVPLDAVRRGGSVWSTTQVPGEETRAARGLEGGGVMTSPSRDDIAPLAEQAARGTLQVDLYRVLPLRDAVSALAGVASGTSRGKVVIDLSL